MLNCDDIYTTISSQWATVMMYSASCKKIYFSRFAAVSSLPMPILPIDSGRYGSKEMRDIFADERRLQYQLNFEAIVARAQAELGMIPEAAALEITQGALPGRITI